MQDYIFKLLISLLVQEKRFYQLHQFLQYHIIDDSVCSMCHGAICSLNVNSFTIAGTRSMSAFIFGEVILASLSARTGHAQAIIEPF